MPTSPAGPLEDARQHLYQGMLILYETKESIHNVDPEILADLTRQYNKLMQTHLTLSERESKKKTRLFAIFQTKGRDVLTHWEQCQEFNIHVQSASASVKAKETESLTSSCVPLSIAQEDFDSQDPFGYIGVPSQPLNDSESLRFSLPNHSSATFSSVDSTVPLTQRPPDGNDSEGSDDGSGDRVTFMPFTGTRTSGEDVVYCRVHNPATMSYDSLSGVLQDS
ncbi:hypothetical protein OE88DRAFT_1655639 [Heliocybe sulcata]|uniref:Uncharacterized protein n=1 Tax=Heliocybe sulcata TaxID=5364 RepID=A0A5C3N8R6_9AGAM|nr:hypothetical protein OE88DRAFT_1655639 [Heliocybe sulcata]